MKITHSIRINAMTGSRGHDRKDVRSTASTTGQMLYAVIDYTLYTGNQNRLYTPYKCELVLNYYIRNRKI